MLIAADWQEKRNAVKPVLNGTWMELNTGKIYGYENFQLKGKKEEKCTLEQAMKVQSGRRGMALLFLQARC